MTSERTKHLSVLPSSWQWVRAEKRATDITVGFVGPMKHHYVASGGVPFLRSQNVRENRIDLTGLCFIDEEFHKELKKSRLLPGDVVIVRTGAPGVAAYVPADFGEANCADLVIFRPDETIDSAFLAHFLNSSEARRQVFHLQVGVAQQHFNVGAMRGLLIPVPASLIEQHDIVAKIEDLTARSRKAREALEAIPPLIEKFKQSVLAAAFRGDLTREWREKHPDVEPASELLKRIRVERRRKWEEAELAKMKAAGKVPRDDRWKEKYKEPEPVHTDGLPELPEGWEWASLAEILELKGGLTLGQKRKPGEVLQDVPYLRVANVQRGHLDLREVRTIQATHEEVAELRLRPGDLLFNEGGDRDKLGRGWVWRGEIPLCIHQNHVFRGRPVAASLRPELVSHYVNTVGQAFFVDTGKQTTNLASVSLTKLGKFPVPLPSTAEQDALLDRIVDLIEPAKALEQALSPLGEAVDSLDQSILAKAFRGELVPREV